MDARTHTRDLNRRLVELQRELREVESALERADVPLTSEGRIESVETLGEPDRDRPPFPEFSTTLTDLLPGAVLLHQDGRVVAANAEAARLLGYRDEQEMVGLPVLQFVHPEEREAVRERIEEVQGRGQSVPPRTERLVDAHGRTLFAEVAGRSLIWNGRPAVLALAHDVTERERAMQALSSLFQATTGTGLDFFAQLTRSLAETLDADYVLVSRISPDGDYLVPLASWTDGSSVTVPPYPAAGTPCRVVVDQGHFFCQEGIEKEFPDDAVLARLGMTAYYGVRADASDGRPLGKLCVLDRRPLPKTPWVESVLRAFAGRIGAELERLEAEAE
ncbi:MAG TPA: PAS domain S-box protein, partial [Planctomycetaceae bacterium]|nr:PAS domain S-box protein [Planctomycetaceae bacterium]